MVKRALAPELFVSPDDMIPGVPDPVDILVGMICQQILMPGVKHTRVFDNRRSETWPNTRYYNHTLLCDKVTVKWYEYREAAVKAIEAWLGVEAPPVPASAVEAL